jgi:WD40 repeat protein
MTIYDLLMPQGRNSVYTTTEIGGSKICVLQRTQQIITMNANKSGTVKLFDIRKMEILDTIELTNSEITCSALSHDQKGLVLGLKDGKVKIIDVRNELLPTRETIDAFYDTVVFRKFWKS